MTILEFEAWVSDHYDELAQVARIACNGAGEDALHSLVEGLCEGREKLPPWDIKRLTTGWFMHKLRSDYLNLKTVERHERENLEAVATSYLVLGLGDTHMDTKRAAVIKAQRRMRLRRKQQSGGMSSVGYPLEGAQFIGNPGGSIRWRYQQMRDDRLFDERAIRSLGESLKRASRRGLHFGKPGHPHGAALGLEPFSQENAR